MTEKDLGTGWHDDLYDPNGRVLSVVFDFSEARAFICCTVERHRSYDCVLNLYSGRESYARSLLPSAMLDHDDMFFANGLLTEFVPFGVNQRSATPNTFHARRAFFPPSLQAWTFLS